MPKAGDEYQDIVALVREALEPGATVKSGQWIVGPDGRRDLDVEVRGMLDGEPHFILIECKDWGRKVGIGVIDALESKRRDLGADTAAIYSNSGFTEPALQKGKRVDIRMFSALRAGDLRIRFVVHRQVVATARSIEKYSIRFFGQSEELSRLPSNWTPYDIYYLGKPLVNFLREESLEILRQECISENIVATYVFSDPVLFEVNRYEVELNALQVVMKCVEKYVSQIVEENVTLGHYDFLNDTISIPNKQALIIGDFDNTKWIDIDMAKFKVEKKVLQPNSLQFGLTLFNPVKGLEEQEIPPLKALLKERRIEIVESAL